MLISLIIPAHNVAPYIEECIHSAFAQTYSHIEVICIDNNSSDDTWKKLEQLKQQYPQLIIDKELKPGAPAASKQYKMLKASNNGWNTKPALPVKLMLLFFAGLFTILEPPKIKYF